MIFMGKAPVSYNYLALRQQNVLTRSANLNFDLECCERLELAPQSSVN